MDFDEDNWYLKKNPGDRNIFLKHKDHRAYKKCVGKAVRDITRKFSIPIRVDDLCKRSN